MEYNIDDFEEIYNMLSGYLKTKYGLLLNYFYIYHDLSYKYFENIEMLKIWFDKESSNKLKINNIFFTYYKK